jgi:hypothetical protein
VYIALDHRNSGNRRTAKLKKQKIDEHQLPPLREPNKTPKCRKVDLSPPPALLVSRKLTKL